MYQTSLAQFNELYELSIDNSEKASLPSKRIANVIEHMTYEIYLYIQVGQQHGASSRQLNHSLIARILWKRCRART